MVLLTKTLRGLDVPSTFIKAELEPFDTAVPVMSATGQIAEPCRREAGWSIAVHHGQHYMNNGKLSLAGIEIRGSSAKATPPAH